MKRLAAIDVGSTSVHLLVADVSDGALEPVLDLSTFAGLGDAVAASGVIGATLTTELAGILAGYVRRATELGAADVVVVATAPLRRAADAARVVPALGLPVHVLTDREEALLALIGATSRRPRSDDLAIVDVGGGSTEVILAVADGEPVVVALPIGAASPAGRRVGEAATLAARALPGAAPTVLLAVGGTADNLARVTGTRRLTRAEIEAALGQLAAGPPESIAARHGIRVERARLLPAGAAILLAVMDRWAVESVEVSPAGLREGAIVALAAAGPAWRDRLPLLVREGSSR